MIFRILNLTSDHTDTRQNITDLYRRLRNCGYTRLTLAPLFHHAYRRVSERLQSPQIKDPVGDMKDTVFFHIPYNSLDPLRRHLQSLFRSVLHSPPNEPPLPTLENTHGSACHVEPTDNGTSKTCYFLAAPAKSRIGQHHLFTLSFPLKSRLSLTTTTIAPPAKAPLLPLQDTPVTNRLIEVSPILHALSAHLEIFSIWAVFYMIFCA
jgi:hypothetical protein